MDSFRQCQPLTFQCSGLALTCGKLIDQEVPEIAKEDVESLGEFLQKARHLPERVREPDTASDLSSVALCLIGAAVGLLAVFFLRRMRHKLAHS